MKERPSKSPSSRPANSASPEKLGLLAKQLASTSAPGKVARIKERLIHDFYGR
jgi:hypothetical protein